MNNDSETVLEKNRRNRMRGKKEVYNGVIQNVMHIVKDARSAFESRKSSAIDC